MSTHPRSQPDSQSGPNRGQRAVAVRVTPRRARNIAAARTVLGRLARVGSILEPIAHAQGSAALRVAALLDDLDLTTTMLVHAIQSADDGGESVGRIQRQLYELEARLRDEWVEELGNAPTSQLDRLADACKLLHGAAFAFQSGTVV